MSPRAGAAPLPCWCVRSCSTVAISISSSLALARGYTRLAGRPTHTLSTAVPSRACTTRPAGTCTGRDPAACGGVYEGSLGLRRGKLDRGDPHRLDWFVAAVGGHTLQLVDHIHAALHLAEHGVFAVQPRARLGGDDEELRAVGVGARVRHRERAAHDLVRVDLVLERVAGTAGAGAQRAAALDHEVADDAVEVEAVVEAVRGELAEVLDRLRRVL